MKKIINGTVVRFEFKDGVAPVTFDVETASVANQIYATAFGFGHRLGDAAASCKTEAERREAVQELATFYEAGGDDWNMKARVHSAEKIAELQATNASLMAELEAFRQMYPSVGE